jgi:hypothetical protein
VPRPPGGPGLGPGARDALPSRPGQERQKRKAAPTIIGSRRTPWAELLPAGQPAAAGFAAALGVGLICGVLNTAYAISYVGLAFPGPLAAGLAPALSLGLLSAAVASVVAALRLSYPGGMGVISPEATLVIGGVGLQFATHVAPTGSCRPCWRP